MALESFTASCMICDGVGNLDWNAVLCPAATCVALVAYPHTSNVQIISHRQQHGCFRQVLSTKPLNVALSRNENLDWLLNDSVPTVEDINLELDEAQR